MSNDWKHVRDLLGISQERVDELEDMLNSKYLENPDLTHVYYSLITDLQKDSERMYIMYYIGFLNGMFSIVNRGYKD